MSYRKDLSNLLARIEARRTELSISHEALYVAAGISRSTYWRMRREGLAFRRNVQALHFALRTICQRREAEARFFDGIGA